MRSLHFVTRSVAATRVRFIFELGLALFAFGSVSCRGGATEQFESVDLSMIYSTTRQHDVKGVTNGKSKVAERLSHLTATNAPSAASNVFLVQGVDIDEAIRATTRVVFGGESCNQFEQGQLWMVAYFGSGGSTPSRWTIKSVQNSEKTVRVFAHRSPNGAESADIHPYYAWIPLGKSMQPKLALELWNHATGERSLVRILDVERK